MEALDPAELAVFARGHCPYCGAQLVELKGPEVAGEMYECVGRFFHHLFRAEYQGAETLVVPMGSTAAQDRGR